MITLPEERPGAREPVAGARPIGLPLCRGARAVPHRDDWTARTTALPWCGVPSCRPVLARTALYRGQPITRFAAFDLDW